MSASIEPIVVTGGATGIGAAVVVRLRQRGCRVIVLDVVAPNGDVDVDVDVDVEADDFVHCDLADPDAIDLVAANLPARIGSLVHVAGIAAHEQADRVVAVNFLGLRRLTESLLPRIVDGGSVVIVASSAGRDWATRLDAVTQLLDTPDFDSALGWLARHPGEWAGNPYKFSKQCAAAYTYRAAGVARRYGVRVNCVNPGATETPLTPAFRALIGPEFYEWVGAQLGRHGTPADVAEVVEFLTIGPCAWLNGVEITVDGGFYAGVLGGWIDMTAAPERIDQ